jgi:ribosomal protein S18 acetylase RimI-like enzyme
MIDESPTTQLVIRLATPEDIPQIELLDSLSLSPTRNIHREMEKYFGSVDPSTHERTLIFLGEANGRALAKAEMMLPIKDDLRSTPNVGYIKRVVVHPDYRKHGLARQMMQHIIDFAHKDQQIEALDLHVWENNIAAIRLYESLGFQQRHKEVYFRLALQ